MNREVHFSAVSDRLATPADTYVALNDEFHFDFDPCPLDGTENGLATLFVDWGGKRVFCNPPYGPGIANWLERGLEAKEIRFIRGRLKFGGATNSAPFPSMIVVFEKEREAVSPI
jgi:hypothetical protein